ncbi:MAG: hypothetical protein ACRED1_10015, partial [Limisphaerales bacterium]
MQRFSVLTLLALALLIAGCRTQGQHHGRAAASALNPTPQAVLAVMQRVADWQLAHPSAHRPTDWTCAAGDAGFMALAGISGDPKY